MNITKITVTGLNKSNMGEVSDADAAGYRAWLAGKLAEEFPDSEVELVEEDAAKGVSVETQDDSDYAAHTAAQDAVAQFLEDCWNACTWDWVY